MKRLVALVAFLVVLVFPDVLHSQTIEFTDVAKEAGVEVRFFDGSRGKHDLPEIMAGGVGLIDVNQDGLLDLFFANGGPIVPMPGIDDPPCRLFLNEGRWRFREITAEAGAPGPSYAMGCAVGDYDRDGRDDLFVSGWRGQRLYRNLGSGRFEDVTDQAGLSDQGWSTSASFADLDLDGDLDLYVCHYVDFDPAKAPYCAAPDGRRDYCGPEEFAAQPDHLYRNNGDGTFTEVSQASGIIDPQGRGLGVVIADLTGDRLPDIFVANDGTPCRLYQNRGGLTLVEVGTEAGVGLDGEGRSMAGMGIAVGDWNGDRLSDLVVTNFLDRSTIAFASQGDGIFVDDSKRSGLAAATRSVLGFGVAIADLDGDGDLDLIQANGHVLDRDRLGVPFAMKSTLLRNERGRFVDQSASGGGFFKRPILGTGAGDWRSGQRWDGSTSWSSPWMVQLPCSGINHGVSLGIRLPSTAWGPRQARSWKLTVAMRSPFTRLLLGAVTSPRRIVAFFWPGVARAWITSS